MTSHLTRRKFLEGAAAGIAGARLLASSQASARAMPYDATPEEDLPGREQGREVLHDFPYGAVALTGGPLKLQYDRVHASYLALENDSLLKVYRQRAGLPAPGRDMGGWYDADGFVPGHSLGQYISGLARIGAATGDAMCRQKVRELVAGFGATLGKDNQSIIRPETNLWPCYILDKHFAGLIDAYNLTHIEEARELMPRVLQGARALLPAHGHDRIGKKNPPYDETYVMPENLFAAHGLTGVPEFRALAIDYLLDREYFDPLARNEDVLPGRQAYSHAIALSSAAKACLVLEDEKYLHAMRNAWTYLTTEQQYASGGWGPNELFVEPRQGKLYESLSTTVDHFETPCGAYAASKLDRYLLRMTGDPRYGDHLERLIYNTVLGVKEPDSDGDYPYYSAYSAQATKVWYPQKWPCCSGTLVQGVADYVLGVYLRGSDGVTVNLYAPSVLRWKQGDTAMKLVQTTDYPAGESASIRIESPAARGWTLRLRIPAWLREPARITVNGRDARAAASPGSFAALQREWKNGDVVEIKLPQPFRAEPIDDRHPQTVAMMRGPVMLVAINPPAGLENTPLALPGGFTSTAQQSDGWTRAVGGQQVVFLPFHQVQNERYTTYFTRA